MIFFVFTFVINNKFVELKFYIHVINCLKQLAISSFRIRVESNGILLPVQIGGIYILCGVLNIFLIAI